jgi:hypothetical protein
MGNLPTPTAVAGKFQSKDGSDLVQYLNAGGAVVLWIDCDGVLHIDPNNLASANGAAQIVSGFKNE